VGNLRDAVKPGATRDIETNRDIDDNTGRETVREREEIDRE